MSINKQSHNFKINYELLLVMMMLNNNVGLNNEDITPEK